MKSPTPQYKKLKKALKKAELITTRVDPLGCRNDLQHLKLQSYIFLTHAALEEYLEELGLGMALEARRIFVGSGIITKTLVALISSKLIDDLPEKRRSKLTSELATNIEEFSKEALTRYCICVKSNNGIIGRDQKAILLPVGVDPEFIDVGLMNSLHSFGTKRGEVAHKFKVQRTETLSSVRNDLLRISENLIAYDSAACQAIALRLK